MSRITPLGTSNLITGQGYSASESDLTSAHLAIAVEHRLPHSRDQQTSPSGEPPRPMSAFLPAATHSCNAMLASNGTVLHQINPNTSHSNNGHAQRPSLSPDIEQQNPVKTPGNTIWQRGRNLLWRKPQSNKASTRHTMPTTTTVSNQIDSDHVLTNSLPFRVKTNSLPAQIRYNNNNNVFLFSEMGEECRPAVAPVQFPLSNEESHPEGENEEEEEVVTCGYKLKEKETSNETTGNAPEEYSSRVLMMRQEANSNTPMCRICHCEESEDPITPNGASIGTSCVVNIRPQSSTLASSQSKTNPVGPVSSGVTNSMSPSVPHNLIAPCLCSGSLKYVHQECLQQWIKCSDSRKCELCHFHYHMKVTTKPLTQWESLRLTRVERRQIFCSVSFHVVALVCVVWSLFVLIDRTTEEIRRGELEWPFWTKLVVVTIGFSGGVIFMYVQCRMYLALCRKWRSYNRIFMVQNLTPDMLQHAQKHAHQPRNSYTQLTHTQHDNNQQVQLHTLHSSSSGPSTENSSTLLVLPPTPSLVTSSLVSGPAPESSSRLLPAATSSTSGPMLTPSEEEEETSLNYASQHLLGLNTTHIPPHHS